MSTARLPFATLSQRLLADLAGGRCAAVVGLSNTGKSTLLRALAAHPLASGGLQAETVYVDCNQAVALTPQAFYEVVLRTLLERLVHGLEPALAASLRHHHRTLAEADSAFVASLSFNLALIEVCQGLARPLCILLDEFDEIYTCLDDRALLNLRALKDRFGARVVFVTATARTMPELRGREAEGEFAELFSGATYRMPPLSPQEIGEALEQYAPDGLSPERAAICIRLSGGHPGLLRALAEGMRDLEPDQQADPERAAGEMPRPRAECLKIWTQLLPAEQAELTTLALQPERRAAPGRFPRLEVLGLLVEGQAHPPLLAEFAAHRARPETPPRRGIELDPDSGDVWVDGARLPPLTDLEYRLLRLLHSRVDKLTDKYQIVTEVWGEAYLGEVDDARVEKLVSRLRSQIEPDPSSPRFLITQRGRGYKLLARPRAG